MRTRKAPWDYKRIKIATPHLERICPECGGNVFPTAPDDVMRCYECRGTEWVMILTSHARAVSELIQMANEEAQARQLAAQVTLNWEGALAVLNEEGSDNRPSTQWQEHGYY